MDTKNLILSIITPAYNSAKWIRVAMNALIPQLTSQVEWIIIDDGSSDATETICQEVATNVSSVRLIRTSNRGAGHARNVGISLARGDWLAFLDSDDLFTDNAIERILEKLQKTSDKTELIYTSRSKTSFDLTAHVDITHPEPVVQHDMPRLEFWTCLYKRDFIDKFNIRFYEYKEQDIETAFRFLAFSNASCTVSDSSLQFYLQRNNELSNTHTWNEYNLYFVKALVYFDLIKRTSKNNGRGDSLRYLEHIFTHSFTSYYRTVQKNGKEKDFRDRSKRLRSCVDSLQNFSTTSWYTKLLLSFYLKRYSV